MEMHQIRYFLAVSRLLNFTQAAEECNVSQPSLTRAIQKLEDELGGELLRRERRTTHITELGRLMLPLLTQSYEGALSAKSLASSYGAGDHAPLSIAISKTVNLEHLTHAIVELSRALPGLLLTFFRGDSAAVFDRLKSGEAELAVAENFETVWDRLNAWPLFTEGFVLMVNTSHRLAGQSSIDVNSLAGEHFLARPYCGEHRQLLAWFRAHGVDGLHSHQMATEEDILVLLEANAGVAILPRSARRSKDIGALEVAGLDLDRTAYLYEVAGRRHLPAVAGLIRILRSAEHGRSREA